MSKFPYRVTNEQVISSPSSFVAVARQPHGGRWAVIRVKHASSDQTVSFPMDGLVPWICEQYREEVADWVRGNMTIKELVG